MINNGFPFNIFGQPFYFIKKNNQNIKNGIMQKKKIK